MTLTEFLLVSTGTRDINSLFGHLQELLKIRLLADCPNNRNPVCDAPMHIQGNYITTRHKENVQMLIIVLLIYFSTF